MRWVAVLLCLSAALLLPSVAHATSRADAAAFAAAAVRASDEIRTAAPQTRIDIAGVDVSACTTSIAQLARLKPGSESFTRAYLLISVLQRTAVFGRTLPALQRFLATLDGIPTSDPRLRSARAGWRAYVADLAVVVAVPIGPQLCPDLKAWVDAGAPGTFMPEIDLTAAARVYANGAGSKQDARIARGAARLRALGERPQRAQRFTVQGMLKEHLRISESLTASYQPPGSQR